MSMRMDVDADMADRNRGFGLVPEPPPPVILSGPRSVLVLLVVLRFGMDKAKPGVLRVNRALNGLPRQTALHGDRQVCWILQTALSADQVVAKVRDLDIGCIENSWCFTPGADVACMLPLDAFKDRIEEAWRNVRRYNAKRSSHRNLPRQFFEIDREVVEDGRRGTATIAILDDHPLDRRGVR